MMLQGELPPMTRLVEINPATVAPPGCRGVWFIPAGQTLVVEVPAAIGGWWFAWHTDHRCQIALVPDPTQFAISIG